MGHARAVAASPDPEALAREIIAKGLSVRQAEARARKRKASRPSELAADRAAQVDADLAALERQLGDMLGLRVKVAHNGSGGHGDAALHRASISST